MNCLICGDDDGLAVLCGRHWSEYVAWDRDRDPNPTTAPHRDEVFDSIEDDRREFERRMP